MVDYLCVIKTTIELFMILTENFSDLKVSRSIIKDIYMVKWHHFYVLELFLLSTQVI